MNDRRIALMVNPKAGKGRAIRICAGIIEKLSALNTSFTLFKTAWPEQLHSFTDIFLVGGDGTLNYFINKYPELAVPITLFKGGSGNDFAWKLYGNTCFEQVFETGMRGRTMAVDAGTCNGKYFINGVGIGFDGQVVKSMGAQRIISAGHIAYLFTVLREILFFREMEVRCTSADNDTVTTAFMISIANGSRYGGGFLVAPQAKINDGELNVVIINKFPLLKRLRYLPLAKSGKHINLPFVHSYTCKKIDVQSESVIPAHLDGELLEANHFQIEILPSRFYFRQLCTPDRNIRS